MPNFSFKLKVLLLLVFLCFSVILANYSMALAMDNGDDSGSASIMSSLEGGYNYVKSFFSNLAEKFMALFIKETPQSTVNNYGPQITEIIKTPPSVPAPAGIETETVIEKNLPASTVSVNQIKNLELQSQNLESRIWNLENQNSPTNNYQPQTTNSDFSSLLASTKSELESKILTSQNYLMNQISSHYMSVPNYGLGFKIDELSDLTITDNGLIIEDGQFLFSSPNGIFKQTGVGQVTFSGNIDANNGLDVSSANFTVGTDKFTIDYSTGNTVISGTVTISATSTIGAIIASGPLQLTSLQNSYITGGGSLGLGTTSPSQLFSANGNAYITGGLGIGVSTTTSGVLQTSGNGYISGNLWVSGQATSTNIYVSNTFGLGTTSPWAKLSIDTQVANSPFLAIGSSTSSYLIVDAYGRTGIGTTSPFALLSVFNPLNTAKPLFAVGTSTGTMFIIDPNGHIGLGTSSPSQLFSANGNAYITGGLGIGVSTTTSGVLQTSGNGYISGNLYVSGQSTSTTSYIASSLGIGTSSPFALLSVHASAGLPSLAIGSSTTTFIIDSNGKVGLGTSSPFALLSLNPRAGSPQLIIGSSTNTSLLIDANGNLSVDANTFYTDAVNNRVGLGTTSPSQLFSANGNAYITGGLGIGVSTTTSGVLETSGNAQIGNNLYVNGAAMFNTLSANTLSAATLSLTTSITFPDATTQTTAANGTTYKEGGERDNDYFCQVRTVGSDGQKLAWANINTSKTCGLNKRCESGLCIVTSFECGVSQVTDADSNTYNTVLINDQCWLASNMMTTKYPDGSAITRGPVDASWNGSDNGYYAYPPNVGNTAEETIGAITSGNLGFVYQWSAAMHGSTAEEAQGICPTGWHVPTDAEQYALENYLKDGGQTCDAGRSGTLDCSAAGTKLSLETLGGTNSSGFTAHLAGFRNTGGGFNYRAAYANFWSSSGSGSNAWYRYLSSASATVGRSSRSKAYGLTVRCLKN